MEMVEESRGRYFEAPTYIDGDAGKSLFLAGGITGCPNWQRGMADSLLETTDLTIFNPRRDNFPIHDPSAAEVQIRWEHFYLKNASAVSFWFCKDTVQPIVLFELGAWSMRSDKPIFVGVEPGYLREQDVRIQMQLARPEVVVVSKVEDLLGQIRDWSLL